jgi:hypothetical protein
MPGVAAQHIAKRGAAATASHTKSTASQIYLTDTMDRGQCGNDRPGFGVHSLSQKLSVNNYKRFSGFLNKKSFVLSALSGFEFECRGMVLYPHS